MTTIAIEKPRSQEVTRTEPTWNKPVFRPNVDIVECADELLVLADMAGTNSKDIDIQFQNGTLTLHAKVQERKTEDTSYVMNEYGIGDFHRTFQVSESIDCDRIIAEYRDGVLALHLPKTEAAKLHKIAVKG